MSGESGQLRMPAPPPAGCKNWLYGERGWKG